MENKTKILIVDDEPINLDFFEVMLDKLGFVVDRAEDGETALEKIKASKPDLIILDNIMPNLSGWEVTRILKNDEEFDDCKNIPIIMFSAMDNVKDKIEGFELGIDDYITKPFNFSEVLARIKAVLHSRELLRQLLDKERRIALIGSLNKSLIYFTQHVKAPVVKLLDQSSKLAHAENDGINRFITSARGEFTSILAAIDGLEDEIKDLNMKDTEDKNGEKILQELEEKFQKHFISLHDRQKELDGVKG